MRHLELHILQSVPVACLNRDDFGSPKTALFGNVQRARVSSQCWKRAARERMREEAPALFGGQRTRLILDLICRILQKDYDLGEEEARNWAKDLSDAISKLDTPSVRVKTLFFTSQQELEALARAYVKCNYDAKKAVKKLAKYPLKDAADIALFGRMVANDHTLTLEGAAMFSHALSTHKVSNEIDFFAAVDDLQPEEKAEASMIGTLEFNSATYYRFAALNLDLLSEHLSALSAAERQEVVRHFVTATLKAVPNARKNSMNAATLPSHVLTIVREEGHPVQLVNAFEKPVRTQGGFLKESISRLEQEYTRLQEVWGLKSALECRLPESSLSSMLNKVVQYVH